MVSSFNYYMPKRNTKMFFVILFILLQIINAEEDLQLVSTLHSEYLGKFSGYGSAVIIHFQVPDDTEFVSFKFSADQTAFSIFSCDLDEVVLYMKHGSIPLVNPSNAKVPKNVFNMTQSPLMHLQFLPDKQPHYFNLTSPRAGYYYAAAFHPFVEPQKEAITQAGLTSECGTFIDAKLYVKKYYIIDLETTNEIAVTVPLFSKENQTYKFYIPEEHSRLIISLKNVIFCQTCTNLTAQLVDNSGNPQDFPTIIVHRSTYTNDTIYYRVNVQPATWYFMQFYFGATNISIDDYGHLTFNVKTFTSMSQNVITSMYKNESAKTDWNMSSLYRSATFRSLRNDHLISYMPYKEYNLVKTGRSDSFEFNFDLHPNSDGKVPLSINLTSTDFTSLKFFLNEAIDVGGALEYIVGFAPRLLRKGSVIKKEREPEHHIVIVCIRNNIMETPTWPNNCTYGNISNTAPIILNKTLSNSTVTLPYPDSGWWYITLKLYCGICVPCKCSESCVKLYDECIKDCEITCEPDHCSNCTSTCEAEIKNNEECGSNCDCDGPCQRLNVTCNSSVLFDVSSYPCFGGSCDKNGRCVFAISQGILYSTCLCSNNYQGLDCSDDTYATSYAMLVLELCLLVISNLIFVPATYIAFKRKYYVEMIVYASAFLSSSFYHMCDAGENVISVCVVRLEVLQFSDFFSGLLAIWVTLIAMAYIPYPWSSISHISGSLILAFGTTLAKQSLAIFVIPVVAGIVIIAARWIYLHKKTGNCFPSKIYLKLYLPIALVISAAGLLMYALFQTRSNYKYLHSLWHISMGLGIMIILPNMETFLPKEEVRNNDELLNGGIPSV